MALEIFILLMVATKTRNHMQIFHKSTIEMRKNIERIKIVFIISVEQKRERTLRLRNMRFFECFGMINQKLKRKKKMIHVKYTETMSLTPVSI